MNVTVKWFYFQQQQQKIFFFKIIYTGIKIIAACANLQNLQCVVLRLSAVGYFESYSETCLKSYS